MPAGQYRDACRLGGYSRLSFGFAFSIPDYAYDYISLVNDLRQERGVEETLQRTVDRTINLWQEFHDEELSGMVVEVTRLRDLTALWDVLRETIDCMHNTMDVVNVTTDLPAVYGETYGQGYLRALFPNMKLTMTIFSGVACHPCRGYCELHSFGGNTKWQYAACFLCKPS